MSWKRKQEQRAKHSLTRGNKPPSPPSPPLLHTSTPPWTFPQWQRTVSTPVRAHAYTIKTDRSLISPPLFSNGLLPAEPLVNGTRFRTQVLPSFARIRPRRGRFKTGLSVVFIECLPAFLSSTRNEHNARPHYKGVRLVPEGPALEEPRSRRRKATRRDPKARRQSLCLEASQ